MSRYPYAKWATMRVMQNSPEYQQRERDKYFSNTGRIEYYDEYARYCRLFGYEYDNCPDGYWDSKMKSWHKPFGAIMGTIGIMFWFIFSVTVSSTGRKQN